MYKAQVKQYYARAGLSDSSMEVQALAQVDQQAESMRQQAINNTLRQGLNALGIANPTLTAGINAGVQQDQQFQQALSRFFASLGQQQTGTPGG